MKTPVSFEIAKLLKEKGFDIPCLSYYSSLNLYTFELGDWNNHTIGDTSMHKRNAGYYSAPTIAEVVMWLYEKYGIWLKIGLYTHLGNVSKFQFTVETKKHKSINSIVQLNTNPYKSPQEAYEAAITYTLNNLI